jgi:hypothetical protein
MLFSELENYIPLAKIKNISFKAVPGIRRLHQVVSTKSNNDTLAVRNMSCYTCENYINGNYNNCKNNAIGGIKVTIPEGTILAVYTDESDSNYYLFRASSYPQVLTKDTTDDWGITYGKGSKIVRVGLLVPTATPHPGETYRMWSGCRYM